MNIADCTQQRRGKKRRQDFLVACLFHTLSLFVVCVVAACRRFRPAAALLLRQQTRSLLTRHVLHISRPTFAAISSVAAAATSSRLREEEMVDDQADEADCRERGGDAHRFGDEACQRRADGDDQCREQRVRGE